MEQTYLATPQDWWNKLNKRFFFTLDAAAEKDHHMGNIPYLTEEQDALSVRWTGSVWCSPPWHKTGLTKWVKKAYDAVTLEPAQIVVMLLPVRTQDRWWHDRLLGKANEILFIRGDLEFTPFDPTMGAFHVEPHCLGVFQKHHRGPTETYSYPCR